MTRTTKRRGTAAVSVGLLVLEACSSSHDQSAPVTVAEIASSVAPPTTTAAAPTTTAPVSTSTTAPPVTEVTIESRDRDRLAHNDTALVRRSDGTGTISASVYEDSALVRHNVPGTVLEPGALVELRSGDLGVLVSLNQRDVEPLNKHLAAQWTSQVVSTDPTFTPGGCGGTPSVFVGGRWEVTLESRIDLDARTNLPLVETMGDTFSNVLVVFDLKDGKFHEITPWPSVEHYTNPVVVDDHRIAVLVTDLFENESTQASGARWHRRIIDLSTMTFVDEPVDLGDRRWLFVNWMIDVDRVYGNDNLWSGELQLERSDGVLVAQRVPVSMEPRAIDGRVVEWGDGVRLIDSESGTELARLDGMEVFSAQVLARRGRSTVLSLSTGVSVVPVVVDESTGTVTSVIDPAFVQQPLALDGSFDYSVSPPSVFIAGVS